MQIQKSAVKLHSLSQYWQNCRRVSKGLTVFDKYPGSLFSFLNTDITSSLKLNRVNQVHSEGNHGYTLANYPLNFLFIPIFHHNYNIQPISCDIWLFSVRFASRHNLNFLGEAGAACLVEGRPALHHFKLWREATPIVNLNA